MSFFRRGPQVNFLSTGCLCVSVILGVTWGSKGCCFFLQIPVIFFKSTKPPWRVSMCPNTFMSGLTWCLASSRGAVKLWRLTTVTWPTATLSTRGAKTCQRLIFISSFSFLSVSPTDLWGRDRLWQVQKRKSNENISKCSSRLVGLTFPLCLFGKHWGHRSENRHADTDPGVWPDAQTAVHQPSPSEDHPEVSEHYAKLEHQLSRRWAISR